MEKRDGDTGNRKQWNDDGPRQSVEAMAAERNLSLFAQQQRARRGPTPEVFFIKRLDNSRLVKAADPVRVREMRIFTCAMACCLCW